MRATRFRDLLLYTVAAGVICWLLVNSFYGSMPKLSWFVPRSLPILAVAEAISGLQLRARIQRRRGATLVDPLVAARSVALAKASAIVGAVMFGAWAGLLGYVLPHRDTIEAARTDTPVGIVGAIGAACLVAAALWLEYCCRTPDRPENSSDDTNRAESDSGNR
jgi:hypothetical protein